MRQNVFSDMQKLREFNIHIAFTNEMLKEVLEQGYKPRRSTGESGNSKTIFIFKKNVRPPFSHLPTLHAETPIKMTVRNFKGRANPQGQRQQRNELETPNANNGEADREESLGERHAAAGVRPVARGSSCPQSLSLLKCLK